MCVFETQDVRRRSLFYPDVMLRGYYPTYVYRLWEENNIHVQMEEGDLDLIRQYRNEFLAFSYYRTTTHEKGQPYFGNTGGDVGTPNPYLKTSAWGWQIDPMGFRFTLNEARDMSLLRLPKASLRLRINKSPSGAFEQPNGLRSRWRGLAPTSDR